MADPVLDHTSIHNILIEAMEARLLQKLKVEPTDNAKAGIVRAGKLQDDPTDAVINILIHPGGEDWQDEIDNIPTSDGETAQFEIGGYGGQFWRRRFIVELSLFYSNQPNRAHARKKSNVVLGRANHALSTQDFTAIPADSFGEKAYRCQVTKAWINEGGGDGDFNWRGKIYIEYQTEIEFTESLA